MRLALLVFALTASTSLTACQTASTINGVRLPVRTAQGGDTFCERNLILCIAGGALVAGAAAAASGGHHGDPPSGPMSGNGSLSGGNRPVTAIP